MTIILGNIGTRFFARYGGSVVLVRRSGVVVAVPVRIALAIAGTRTCHGGIDLILTKLKL